MEKLEEHNSSVPIHSDKLWHTIIEKLDQNDEKKKKFIFWPYSIAAGILAIIGMTYFLYNNEENSLNDNLPAAAYTNENSSLLPGKTKFTEEIRPDYNNGIAEQNTGQSVVRYSKNLPKNKPSDHILTNTKKQEDATAENTIEDQLNESAITKNVHRKKSYQTVNNTDEDAPYSSGINRNNYASNMSDPKKTDDKEVVIETGHIKTTTKESTSWAPPVTAKDLENFPVHNIFKASDVPHGTVTTHTSGQPGSSPNISIRGTGSISGSNTPLYIVDGAVYQGNISQINPKDIDNIVTLKDAAATSLYGSRGAHGVIVITTKTGTKNKGKKKNFIQRIFSPKKKDKSSSIDHTPVVPLRNLMTQESYSRIAENDFKISNLDPLSTFSIDVDKASYTNIRRMIRHNTVIPPDAVRSEEFINYFKYKYNQPESRHPIRLESEIAECPWNSRHHLLRISLQGRDIQKELLPPSNLVFLIDISGSMNDANKLPLVKESMLTLLEQLRPQDYVSIVTYASGVNVVLESTSAKHRKTIINAIKNLQASGGTSGHDGLNLAYEQAMKNFIEDGNNRVILATDGDFNIGPSTTFEMEKLIEEKRKSNIYLTCLGYGMGNYNDNMMKTLSSKGNGNYAYIDNIDEANQVLNHEFSSTMFVIAKDVKLQVEFNPEIVQAYRLIGYEKRILNHQDFNNDKIDAGDMGAGHQVTALYEIIPAGVKSDFIKEDIPLKYSYRVRNKGTADPEVATIQFRYKNNNSDTSLLLSHTVNNTPLPKTSNDFRLAASLAWYAQWLRGSKYVEEDAQKDILIYLNEISDNDYKVYTKELKENISIISENQLKYTFPAEDLVKNNTQNHQD